MNTRPEAGPSAFRPALGSSSATPLISASTPAPVSADPKNTGYTCPRLVCAASSSRSRRYGTRGSLRTYAAIIASSCSASTSVSRAVKAASEPSQQAKLAVRAPSSCTEPIATMAGVSRSEISRSRRA